MHILYLVPHVPRATKARSYYHIRGLLDAGHQVAVATLQSSAEDAKAIRALEQMGCTVIYASLTKPMMLMNCLSALTHRLPLQAKIMWSGTLMYKLEAYIQANKPDIAHVEHLRMADYGLRLKPKLPVIWDAVDHLTSLYKQAATISVSRLWQLAARWEAPHLENHERWLTSQFPLTLVITYRDQALFQQNNPYQERICVAPLGLPLPTLKANPERSNNTLVITGTLNYHPNVAAVHYFITEIFPLVLESQPDVKLLLVGANPIQSITALQSDNIIVTGFVPSIDDYLQTAAVALAPVKYGSGVQVKVLEAFSTATPLVATSVALRGLEARHDEQAIVADTPASFAAAILELLSDAALRQRIGTAGRHYVEQNHDLRETTRNLIELYRRIM